MEVAFLQVKAVVLLLNGEDGLIAGVVELLLGVAGGAVLLTLIASMMTCEDILRVY